MKKRLCLLLALALLTGMLLSGGVMTASALAMGDINGDGKVTSTDARLVLLASVDSVTLTAAQQLAADVNYDGKVTTTDARLILTGQFDPNGGQKTVSLLPTAVSQWRAAPLTVGSVTSQVNVTALNQGYYLDNDQNANWPSVRYTQENVVTAPQDAEIVYDFTAGGSIRMDLFFGGQTPEGYGDNSVSLSSYIDASKTDSSGDLAAGTYTGSFRLSDMTELASMEAADLNGRILVSGLRVYVINGDATVRKLSVKAYEQESQPTITQKQYVDDTADASLMAVRSNLNTNTVSGERTGLASLTAMELYKDGVRVADTARLNTVTMVNYDYKKIYRTAEYKRVVDYTNGFRLDMPNNWVPDYSLGKLRVRYDCADTSLIVSREDAGFAAYSSKQEALNTLYRFINDSTFQQINNVTYLSDSNETINGYSAYVLRLKMENMPANSKCYYTYVSLYSGSRCYQMMIKSTKDTDFASVYQTFNAFTAYGRTIDTVTYPVTANSRWDATTREYYQSLKSSNDISWGVFCPQIETTGWNTTIPAYQAAFDKTFELTSQYEHLGTVFPSAFAQKVGASGKVLQLSYQFTNSNNTDLNAYDPVLDILRGQKDGALRVLAKRIKAYGKPVLFRLNNEMNTDWTTYSGIVNMLDPDLFVESWNRLYQIFEEEGVDNCMWIFNAFNGSYPPFRWANYRCYFPQGQVQLLGLTAYNAGVHTDGSGTWESFRTLYDELQAEYSVYFPGADWPWIVSEFGCASNGGGSKSTWISDMFTDLAARRYPEIKAMVWFSCNDYEADGVTVRNNFMMDENEAVIAAFRNGFAKLSTE